MRIKWKNRIAAILLIFVMAVGMLPMTAFAADTSGQTSESYDISTNDIEIIESNVCTITQSDKDKTINRITIKSGVTADVTIDDLNIVAEDGPAILVETNATLNLRLEGSSNLSGAEFFAGISVEPGATLNILGAGELTVYGGGGSAGIGGDLGTQLRNSMPAEKVNFGTIHFTEDFGGTINAYGGPYQDFAYHGAAAIGTGSVNAYNNTYIDTTHRMSGTIIIDNGTVNAYSYRTGDESDDNIDNGNGAAIGCGSWTVPYMPSDVKITINGGNINAIGCGDGAGIGAGGNTGVGKISINGGTIVAIGGEYHATGIGTCYLQEFPSDVYVGEISINGGDIKAVGGAWGAGIGSGMRGECTKISIGGSATVNAKGGDYAPGIGPGFVGMSSSIEISGQAKVVATGGTNASGMGTAQSSENVTINISNTAQVYAYGQPRAHAIGPSNKADGVTNLTLSDTITLWAQNGDTNAPAIPQDAKYIKESENGGVYLTTYTSGADSENKAFGRLTDDLAADYNAISVDWTHKAPQYVTLNGFDIDTLMEQTSIPGNWATLYSAPTPEYTVAYDDNGGTGDMTDAHSPYKADSEVTVLANKFIRNGYDFTGWNTAADGSGTAYAAGNTFTINEDTVLYAQWKSTGGGGGGTTYYTLKYESNGGTEYKDERYSRNTVVDLDKVPSREGYAFTGWYADKALTTQISEIKMTSSKTVYAGWRQSTVPDMLNGSDHFAYVVGYPNGNVGPTDNITRAEVATIFFRLLKADVRDTNLTKVNSFSDVPEGSWFNTPISTMKHLGIIKGRAPELFAPGAEITRAEFAAICARFDTSVENGNSNFPDISGHWAEAEIQRAATLGWIQGLPDGTFQPDRYITRAEAMTMINRVLCRIPETESDLLSGMRVWPDNQPGAWYYLAVQESTNSHTFEAKGEIYEHWLTLTEDPDWSKYQ